MDDSLHNSLRSWLDEKLGVSLSQAGSDPVPVYGSTRRKFSSSPLWAIKLGKTGIITVAPRLVDVITPISRKLSMDELFSTFASYELSRVLLADDIGIWVHGPTFYYIGNNIYYQKLKDLLPVQLSTSEMFARFDHKIFWHCLGETEIIGKSDLKVGFGIFESNKPAALATVRAESSQFWEIGVDVSPEVQRHGLGLAVVSAACDWILEHNRLILYKTAPWNIPSTRVARALGLHYALTDMEGMPGKFRVMPQPLGKPRPGVEMFNYYPDWAMNKRIKSAAAVPQRPTD